MSPSRRPPSTRRASERSAIEREQAAQLQTATYRISEAAHAAEDLAQLFRAVHDIISELMPAKNLYIALYDAHAGLLSFPYWVDEHDPPPARHKLERGLTEYVLRTGQPLLATPEVRSEEHTSELQSPCNLVCRLLLEKKKKLSRCKLLYIWFSS